MPCELVHLCVQCSILIEQHGQVVKQKAELQAERDTLKRSATPRPDWSRCADVVYGGATRWGELATGKRSSDLLAILIDELDGASAHGTPVLTVLFCTLL